MEWTRSSTVRALVVGLLGVLLLVQVVRDEWSWALVTAALLALNVVSWRRQTTRTGSTSASDSDDLGPPDGVEVRLATLLHRLPVQRAWSAGPAVWQQAAHVKGGDDLQLSAAEVADHVWIGRDPGRLRGAPPEWSVAVDDELKPLLDLDLVEEQDPLVRVLAEHPSTTDVAHVDREVYCFAERHPMTLEEVAVLAARGLIAHHRAAGSGPGR